MKGKGKSFGQIPAISLFLAQALCPLIGGEVSLKEQLSAEKRVDEPVQAATPAEGSVDELKELPDAREAWRNVAEWLRKQSVDTDSSSRNLRDLPAEPPADPEERLRLVAERLAHFDEKARQAWLFWSSQQATGEAEAIACLEDDRLPEAVRASVATLHGLWLLREKRYDEALQVFRNFPTRSGVAPEAAIYGQSVAYFLLGQGPEAHRLAELLRTGPATLPVRYRVIAQAICAEVPRWEKSPLRQVSQLMGDAARRLSLARQDPQLVPQQDRILEILDRMIEEASRRRKKAQAPAGGTIRSQAPAEESVPLGGKGPGEVAPRTLSGKSDWGALPPKDREEALQAIGREFPPQYRQVIEQYFRRLAEEPAGRQPGETSPSER